MYYDAEETANMSKKVRRALWRARYGVEIMLCGGFVWVQQKVASAAVTSKQVTDYSFTMAKKTKNTPKPSPAINADPFSYVDKDSAKITTNTSIRGAATDWYKLMIPIGIIGFMFAIFAFAFSKMANTRPEARYEAKNKFGVKIIAFLVVIGFSFVIGQLYLIAKKFLI